jgi:hypothetical protein
MTLWLVELKQLPTKNHAALASRMPAPVLGML